MKKQRSKNPELEKAHDEAWKALKAHPLSLEIEKLYETLSDLQTWNPAHETLQDHMVRHEAGKPRELWDKIQRLQNKLSVTPESKRWFELHRTKRRS